MLCTRWVTVLVGLIAQTELTTGVSARGHLRNHRAHRVLKQSSHNNPSVNSTSRLSGSSALPSKASNGNSTQFSTTFANSTSGTTTCTNIRVRREWRKFSRQEKIDYITSVKCLTTKPSKLLTHGGYRRYDDFQYVHSRMRDKIHWVASFLACKEFFLLSFHPFAKQSQTFLLFFFSPQGIGTLCFSGRKPSRMNVVTKVISLVGIGLWIQRM